MKQSKSKYILGVALIGIWGLVAYQLYNKFSAKEVSWVMQEESIEGIPVLKKDSFVLLMNYRDPFGEQKKRRKKSGITPVVNVKPSIQKARPAALKKKSKAWPAIIYKGNLQPKNGRKAALVQVVNQTFNMYLGDQQEGVTLFQIHPDSIRVIFQEEEKTILKAAN